jgi:hypothetical protein
MSQLGGMVKLLIKILLCSFPLIAAGVFFWPDIQGEATGEPVQQEIVVLSRSSQPQAVPLSPKPKIVKQAVPVQETEARIYRWVDENGRTVFSDQPNHKNASVYTPKELGYISVSGTPEPASSHVESAAKPVQISSRVATANKVAQLPEFKFTALSANQRGEYLELSGRVFAGYACKKLRINARAKSNLGRSVRLSTIISTQGSGSSIFYIKKKIGADSQGRWPIWTQSTPSAVCLEK